MRKLLNIEIAKFVFEEMKNKKKDYKIEQDKILQMIDDSILYDENYQKDENGDIEREMTEEEIKELKEKILNGVEEYYDSINEEF